MNPTRKLPAVIFALSADIISVSATGDRCINPLSGKTSQRCYCRHNPCMYFQQSDNEGCRVDNCGGCHPVYPGDKEPYVKGVPNKCDHVQLKQCRTFNKLVGPNPYKGCRYWPCPEDEHEMQEECTTPDGVQGKIVPCLIDPCTVAKKPEDLKGMDVVCETNYCNGCHAVFVTKEKEYKGNKGEKEYKGNKGEKEFNGNKGEKGQKSQGGSGVGKGEKGNDNENYTVDGVEGPDTVVCTDDVKECADGSYVSRDDERACEFVPCPDERVSSPNKGEKEFNGNKGEKEFNGNKGEKEFNGNKGEKGQKSQGGLGVGKGEKGNDNENYTVDGNEGPENVFCTLDVKECDDGSFVSRDPERECEFDRCPDAPDERISPPNEGEKEYKGNKGEKEFNGNKGEKEFNGNKGEKEFYGNKGEKGQKSQGASGVGKGEKGKEGDDAKDDNGNKGEKKDPSYEMAKHSKFAISSEETSETSSEEPSPEYLAHDPAERSSNEESISNRRLHKHLRNIRGSH